MTKETGPMVRLAFREEGNFWNAYLARPGTMDGSMLIGSIVMGAVQQSPEVKAMFMALMQCVLAEGLSSIGVGIEGWGEPVAAPERERAGHG